MNVYNANLPLSLLIMWFHNYELFLHLFLQNYCPKSDILICIIRCNLKHNNEHAILRQHSSTLPSSTPAINYLLEKSAQWQVISWVHYCLFGISPDTLLSETSSPSPISLINRQSTNKTQRWYPFRTLLPPFYWLHKSKSFSETQNHSSHNYDLNSCSSLSPQGS